MGALFCAFDALGGSCGAAGVVMASGKMKIVKAMATASMIVIVGLR
jgi:hypothetical protein